MDTIDKTSIAILVVYIFGVCLAGFWGVFQTLRNSRRQQHRQVQPEAMLDLVQTSSLRLRYKISTPGTVCNVLRHA